VTAYYNEHDPFAAAWLRELIADGLIAPGEVDERSIEDVRPSDLAGFVQCHFFAGIGIWSLALRQAGWPDDAPIWTGSCPCQPFSAAGKGGGFDDERHLWPAFHWLIEQCGPELVLGEQVASKDGLAWLDLVSADVEASGYAFGAADTCAAGFGAPHIRQRLYWMADAQRGGRQQLALERPASVVCGEAREVVLLESGDHGAGDGRVADADAERSEGWTFRNAHNQVGRLCSKPSDGRHSSLRSGEADGLAHSSSEGPQELVGRLEQSSRLAEAGAARWLADSDGRNAGAEGLQRSGEQRQQPQDGGLMRLEHARGERRKRRQATAPGHEHDGPASERPESEHGAGLASAYRDAATERPGPLNGLWRAADWLCCTDGKWRPVAPGTFPLAPAGTVRNRVGTLRGAGNAINLAQAQGFVESVIAVRAHAESLAA
jgi:DNA (cytosine-5)-methyltransferase 1